MLKKLDYKTIFILVLAIVVVLLIVFRPSKSIEKYEDEIKQLQLDNERLFGNNDSLKTANKLLSEENEKLLRDIDNNTAMADSADKKITGLENEKDNVSDMVRKLNANGVTDALSNYVEMRAKQNDYIH